MASGPVDAVALESAGGHSWFSHRSEWLAEMPVMGYEGKSFGGSEENDRLKWNHHLITGNKISIR